MIRKKRTNSGAALLTVLIMGTVSIAFLMAIAGIVTSANKANSTMKWATGLRNCAEIGIDYAVDQFNTTYPCVLDPSAQSSLITSLPEGELIGAQVDGTTPSPGIPNVKVTIKVTRLSLDEWKELKEFSSLYSPQLDPNNSISSNDWNSPQSTNLTEASGGGFRVVESTATNGIISKTIRVILKARFDIQPDGGEPLKTSGSPSGSYFQNPLFGNSSVTTTGNINIRQDPLKGPNVTHSSPDGKFQIFNLNVATNRLASIGTGSTVSGDITVLSQNSASNNVITAPGAPNASIEGRVLTNGNVDSSTVKGFDDAGNVLAKADFPSSPSGVRQGDNNTPISTPTSSSQVQVAPIATPATAGSLSALSTYTDIGASPTSSGINVFQTPSLSTENIPAGKSVTFNNSVTPVDIFIDQGSSSTSAVNIDTGKISTTSADSSNFRIWYEGNKPVNINLTGDFKGMIYAPNANIKVTGGKDFSGALVGKNVDINATTGTINLNINTDFAPNSTSSGSGSAAKGPHYYVRPGEGALIQGWQAVSWNEF